MVSSSCKQFEIANTIIDKIKSDLFITKLSLFVKGNITCLLKIHNFTVE